MSRVASSIRDRVAWTRSRKRRRSPSSSIFLMRSLCPPFRQPHFSMTALSRPRLKL